MDKARDAQKEILLVPLGKVLVDILEEIAVALRKTYKLHVRIGRSEEPDTVMYSDERRQFDAQRLLALIAGRKRDNLVAVLGVVDADMFSGEKSFVFGVNAPERGAAVLALARLREEFYKKPGKRELFLRRAVTEAIFQVGQAQGLPACQQKKCVMLPVSSLWKLDEKGQTMCETCLRRLSAGFGARAAMPAATGSESGGVDEDPAPGPETETRVLPDLTRAAGPQTEDESEIPAAIIEPENPPAAEELAVHPERTGPDEPLIADR